MSSQEINHGILKKLGDANLAHVYLKDVTLSIKSGTRGAKKLTASAMLRVSFKGEAGARVQDRLFFVVRRIGYWIQPSRARGTSGVVGTQAGCEVRFAPTRVQLNDQREVSDFLRRDPGGLKPSFHDLLTRFDMFESLKPIVHALDPRMAGAAESEAERFLRGQTPTRTAAPSARGLSGNASASSLGPETPYSGGVPMRQPHSTTPVVSSSPAVTSPANRLASRAHLLRGYRNVVGGGGVGSGFRTSTPRVGAVAPRFGGSVHSRFHSRSLLRARASASPRLSVARGLRNIGNTCYLGAVLQCLLSLAHFVDDLRSPPWRLAATAFAQQRKREKRKRESLGQAPTPASDAGALGETVRACAGALQAGLDSLYGALHAADGVARDAAPHGVKRALARYRHEFGSSRQQDAHELMLELLSCLSAEQSHYLSLAVRETVLLEGVDEARNDARAAAMLAIGAATDPLVTPERVEQVLCGAAPEAVAALATGKAAAEATAADAGTTEDAGATEDAGEGNDGSEGLASGLRSAAVAARALLPVERAFACTVRTELRCPACARERFAEAPSLALSVALPPPGHGRGGAPVSLAEALDLFAAAERVRAECPGCGHAWARKRARLGSLPRVLVVHLKRFAWERAPSVAGCPPRLQAVKDPRPVALPLTLDVRALCAPLCSLPPAGACDRTVARRSPLVKAAAGSVVGLNRAATPQARSSGSSLLARAPSARRALPLGVRPVVSDEARRQEERDIATAIALSERDARERRSRSASATPAAAAAPDSSPAMSSRRPAERARADVVSPTRAGSKAAAARADGSTDGVWVVVGDSPSRKRRSPANSTGDRSSARRKRRAALARAATRDPGAATAEVLDVTSGESANDNDKDDNDDDDDDVVVVVVEDAAEARTGPAKETRRRAKNGCDRGGSGGEAAESSERAGAQADADAGATATATATVRDASGRGHQPAVGAEAGEEAGAAMAEAEDTITDDEAVGGSDAVEGAVPFAGDGHDSDRDEDGSADAAEPPLEESELLPGPAPRFVTWRSAMLSDPDEEPEGTESPPTYHLQCVLQHWGKSISHGHYTAAVKNLDRTGAPQWVNYDDSSTSVIPNFQTQLSSPAMQQRAYIAFYVLGE